MNEDVLFEKREGIATLTLNRAAARNAMTRGMAEALTSAVQQLRSDREVRVVVLNAAGTDFTVGADLKDMSTSLNPLPSARGREIAQLARATSVPLFTGLHELTQPIVASVRGHAIGVGAQLLLSADLVVASESLKLLIPQARLAHSVDHGESYFLPRKVGMARTMQLLLLAETLTAVQAERFGLVNWVVPDADLEARTVEIVQRLAGVAPVAVAQIKSLVRHSLDHTLAEQFEAEMNSLAVCAATEDFPEAMNAFIEKRRPVFRGR